MRRKRGREGMRRLRAGLVTPHSGGPGTRSGGITTPPRGARWTGTVPRGFGRAKARQADEANWHRSLEKKPERTPGNADPGTEKPRSGAPRGASPLASGEDTPRQACRAASPAAQGASQAPAFFGAPRPLTGRDDGDDGLPGAAKNTGDGARLLFENQIGARARASGDDAGARRNRWRWGGRPRDSDRHSRTRHRDSNDLPKRSGRASSNLATLS